MSSPVRHRGHSRDQRDLNNCRDYESPSISRQHTQARTGNRSQNSRSNYSHRSRERSRSPRYNTSHDRDDRRSERRGYNHEYRGHNIESRFSNYNDQRRDSGRDRYRDHEKSHSRNRSYEDRDFRVSYIQDDTSEFSNEANHETIDEISPTPTNCLLLRKLAPSTTEERILEELGMISSVELKNMKVLRDKDGDSRGICLIELRSIMEAHQLYNRLTSIRPPFAIDGNVLISSFGRKHPLLKPQVLASSAASTALEAAQWSNRSTNSLDVESRQSQTTSQTTGYNHPEPSGPPKQATISSLGTINIDGLVYKKWPLPDITTYVLEEKSGFLYDHLTGFYYDSNSRYYYDSANTRYLYYDPEHQAYLPADYLLKKNESNSEKGAHASQSATQTKQEKVKTATKVAKDMEKWAKTLNQKRDALKNPAQSTSNSGEVSTELTGTTTSRAVSLKNSTSKNHRSQSPSDPSISKLLVELSREDTKASSIDLKSLLKLEEEKLLDYDKLACLLCKRVLNSKELLIKHRQMSEMHASNLEKLKTDLFTNELIEECEKRDREKAYRDRALERRLRRGLPDDLIDTLPENKYSRDSDSSKVTRNKCEPTKSNPETPLSLDSKGVSLLSKMGWKEGSGIGRSNQGMKDILKVEPRTGKTGLGVKTYKHDPGTSYKDAVKQVMYQRYRELADDDN